MPGTEMRLVACVSTVSGGSSMLLFLFRGKHAQGSIYVQIREANIPPFHTQPDYTLMQ